jgi:hypothetical protein
LFSFPSSLSSSSRFRSFVRSFDAIVLSRARASEREREREREFKSENLSETSSISREWNFPGKTKHKFFKNEQSFSLNLSSFPLSERSPPKALARDVAENVFCRAFFFFSRSIRDDNTPPPPKKKKKGF